MAVAISVEASELLQHFVWLDTRQSEERLLHKKDEIASEMADIAILLFEMADNSGVDLSSSILKKIEHNEQRYPVDKARGSNKKYNEL
jgi:dCTP diphosphatase